MHSCPPAQVPALERSVPAPGLPWAGGWAENGASDGTGDTGIHRWPSWYRNHIQVPFKAPWAHRAFSLSRTAQHPARGPCLSCRTFTEVFSLPSLPRMLRERQQDPGSDLWDGRGPAGACGQEPPELPWEQETRGNKKTKLYIPRKHL